MYFDDNSKALEFTGKLILSMPQIEDSRFDHSVIYICSHREQGSMGIILNKIFDTVTFKDVLKQFELNMDPHYEFVPVHFGGPVETSRGFVLHSNDYFHEGTLQVTNQISLTATMDILKAIAEGHGPHQFLLSLGYAGWGPGQLEAEIQENSWLVAPAKKHLIFDKNLHTKWRAAMEEIGINSEMLSSETGHA